MEERGRNEHALAHALRERRHRAVTAVVQLEQPQQFGNACFERSRGQPAKPPDQHEVVRRREMRVQRGLLRDVSDASLVRDRIVGRADATERDVAGARLE